jgi:hypothetical protein
MLYKQVQARLRNGDLAGAQQAAAQITDKDFQGFALKEIAQVQVQAGDLAGAEATAQAMPYQDTQGGVLGGIAKAHLTRGDIAKAQQLAATMSYAYAWSSLTRAIAEAQLRAGAASEARQTLTAAQQHLQTWSEGDHWNGYPREDALCQIVQAQLSISDVAGATYTAQSITRPEEQSRALRTITEHTSNAADTARKGADPA